VNRVSDEGDDLLRHIRGFVHGRVPPNLENLVTELVGRTVVLVMTTPEFCNHLKAVQELQQENWNLRQALIAQSSQRHPSTRRKAAPKKAAAPVKKAVKKAPAKKAASSNVRAFKRGATGR
jgi:hypothetical protein